MREYQKARLAQVLREKGYHHFTIESFLVFGQSSWLIAIYRGDGQLLRRLGGPSTKYADVSDQVTALPGVLSPPTYDPG